MAAVSDARGRAQTVGAGPIPIAGPWVTDREVDYVARAAAEDWYGNAGASLSRFEQAFAARIGVAHAIAVPHCTAALHLALLAAGVGPGDEVIVPDITWVATAAPIYYVGATPVFADVDPESWCLTPESIERCLSDTTAAVITVDLYGAMPDMDAIEALADRAGVFVIEDAAEAVGATWNGSPAGSFGLAGTFSFHGSKTLTTGEGGMLVTDDDDVHSRVLFLRDHGRPVGAHRHFLTTEIGYKYRMSSLQAAFGLAQVERLDDLIARKRQIFEWYRQRLEDLPGVVLNAERPGLVNTYWMVTAVVDRSYGVSTPELMDRLLEHDVQSRPFFHPLSSLPAFAGAPDAAAAAIRNTVSYDLSPRSINLPSALLLDESDIDQVCNAFRAVLGER